MIKKALGFFVLFPIIFAGCNEPVRENSADLEERHPEPVIASRREPSPKIGAEERKSTRDYNQMTDSNGIDVDGFRQRVAQNLTRGGITISDAVDETDSVEKRIFAEYGAVFVTKAKPPPKVMFTSENEVLEYQKSAGISQETFGGVTIELQPAAMDALRSAVDEARSEGLRISPRDGVEAGRRNFEKTLELWNSRFEPALKHWRSRERLSKEQVSRLRSMPIKQQVSEVLGLEKRGIYFNTFFNNSILYSVAPPGTSQHLSMLAFDVAEHSNPRVRALMAKHGWFRTVQHDTPHFTYLGYGENELPSLGLKRVRKGDGHFWIPDV